VPLPRCAAVASDAHAPQEISFFTQQQHQQQQQHQRGPAKSKSAFQPTTSFQMSPPKPRRTATATVAAPLASVKVDNKPTTTTAKSLKPEARNGHISPAMKKVQTQLAQVKAEMDQTKKLAFEIPMSPLDSPADTKPNSAAAAAARDDETRQIAASFDIHDDDDTAADDDDADDIVISLPKAAAKVPAPAKPMHAPAPAVTVAAPVAPKTPTAADLRARAKAIDQQPTTVSMSLEERVAMLEKELREERAARIQLEKRLAHLFKSS
jgi:hypothetical protein